MIFIAVVLVLIVTIALFESRIEHHIIIPSMETSKSASMSQLFPLLEASTDIYDVRKAEETRRKKLMELSPLKINVLLGTRKSKFAYITLVHGIDNTFSYRGFLYNALIMKKSLADLGSTADFIVMLGFTTLGDTLDHKIFTQDIALLEDAGMRILYLPRLRAEHRKVNFMEMALLKITPWNLTEYDRIQYFDGDILPTKNMDCFFQYNINTFNTGNASPLNSGWFLAIPNPESHSDMLQKAITRIENPWNEKVGWGTAIPLGTTFRGRSKNVNVWNFNGASLDQGLLFHTFALHGTVMMLDVTDATKYSLNGSMKEIVSLDVALLRSNGQSPTDSFIHFTGRNKPWLQNLRKTRNKSLILWTTLLDKLQLPINSMNYELLGKKVPLGFFASNK